MRLDQITTKDVDDYRLSKAGKLSPSAVNKTLATLAAVMEQAVEYGLIGHNPARGRARRAKGKPRGRTFIDRADHLGALLDGAGALDAKARTNRGQRRAMIATLAFAGLRLGEALALRWSDVDLARGTVRVRKSKTEAGERTVNLLPILRDELDALRARIDPVPASLVFGTAKGQPHNPNNVRNRVLAPAVAHANTMLAKVRTEPLPDGLTPHSLRRTFASILFALGEPPPYVMAQMGHATPTLTLAIYARQMDRRDGEPDRLRALVEGRVWTANGQQAPNPTIETPIGDAQKPPETPVESAHTPE